MSATYSQPQKQRARSLALSHAVDVLTHQRSSGAIVNRDYVAKVRQTLSDRLDSDAYFASQCSDKAIGDWELFWDSKVGPKKPGDLVIAYLAGPEPMNDFEELVRLGVHPHNIYGFESDNQVFNEALKNAKRSSFPLIKVIKMPLDKYLQAVPHTFDIIYFDACGPLPSSQATLRTVANVFRYQRLNPLGVLVTNFAKPDIANAEHLTSYSDLVAAYLYPKGMLESGKVDWNLTEGARAHGKVPKEEHCDDSFFHEVRSDFSNYYGQYITRQLFDLGSFVVPLARLSANQLWSHFFSKTPEELTKLASRSMAFSEDSDDSTIENDEMHTFKRAPDGDYIVDADMNPLGWTLASLRTHSDPNYLIPDKSSTKLLGIWNRELGGFPQLNAGDVVHAYLHLRNGYSPEALKPSMQELLNGYRYMDRMYQFCDVPTGELALFPALAQYSMPYHYNVEQTRRYSYVAEGKSTEMFLDVIPFDTCRYIYDWLPSTELIAESFDTKEHQLVYRFAMDGLLKHSLRYNNEYVFGGHVVGVFTEGFTERLLIPRQTIS